MNSKTDGQRKSQEAVTSELDRQLAIILKHPSLSQRFIDISNLITNIISINQPDNSQSIIQPYVADIEQMTNVRILIKHLHFFANSFFYSPVNITNHHQREIEMRQAVWISKYPLQKTFYTFIKTAFQRWPMDYTFRQPLETWLSYIQPWRYVELSSTDNDDPDTNKSNFLTNSPSVDNNWRDFMSDNLFFYTIMFGRLVNRLLQVDLSSSRNSLMLYRVIKVYSQPGFLELLRDAEEAVCRGNLEQRAPFNSLYPKTQAETSISSGKLLAPTLLSNSQIGSSRWVLSTFKHPLMELESESEFEYVSLSSPKMKQQLARLLQDVCRARENIKDIIQEMKTRPKVQEKNWLQSIQAFFIIDDNDLRSKDELDVYKDKIAADENLSIIASKITQCFDIPVPVAKPLSRNSSYENQKSFNQSETFHQKTPLTFLKQRANQHLTSTPKADFDRTLSRLNTEIRRPTKTDNFFEGNPDLQPVRSFEIELLVKFFIWLSQVINAKFNMNIQALYRDYSFARLFISSPVDYIQVDRCPNSIVSKRTIQHLPARVNLRYLAHRQSVVCFIVILVLIYLYL